MHLKNKKTNADKKPNPYPDVVEDVRLPVPPGSN